MRNPTGKVELRGLSLRTTPPKQRKNSMKLTSNLLVSLMLTLTALLTGCKNLTPQGAASLTSLAVYEFGKDNPKATATMRLAQPVACELVKSPGSTVEDVIGAIQNAGGVSPDTKEVLQVLLAIYQTSIYQVGTNQAQTHPYLEAVICPGWQRGLELIGSKEKPRARGWILIK